MARCKDAKDVTKLVKTAIRTMINEYKGERALVILSDGIEEEPKPTAFYGFDSSSIWSDSSVPHGILKEVLARKKVAFFQNAHKEWDGLSRGCNPAIVCVPITAGLIYCDHSQESYFTHNLREYIKRLGQEFDERYEELEGGAPTPEARGPRTSTGSSEPVKIRRYNSHNWQFAVQIFTVLFSIFGFCVVVYMMTLF